VKKKIKLNDHAVRKLTLTLMSYIPNMMQTSLVAVDVFERGENCYRFPHI